MNYLKLTVSRDSFFLSVNYSIVVLELLGHLGEVKCRSKMPFKNRDGLIARIVMFRGISKWNERFLTQQCSQTMIAMNFSCSCQYKISWEPHLEAGVMYSNEENHINSRNKGSTPGSLHTVMLFWETHWVSRGKALAKTLSRPWMNWLSLMRQGSIKFFRPKFIAYV